jgi:copper resistance protein D
VDDPLIYVRAIHFGATIALAGVIFFVVLVAEPAFAAAASDTPLPATLRRRFAVIAWIALVLTLLTGAAWLILVAQSMSDQSISELFTDGVLWTVLLHTGFGRDWLERLVLIGVLAAVLTPFLSTRGAGSRWIKLAAAVLAAALVGTLAFAGHAAGGPGAEGVVHPLADILHLIAAAAWIGMLLPLAVLLAAAGQDAASAAIARAATVRFSTAGIFSVAVLLITGSINTWYLAGSLPALTQTRYGHLLLIKIALFLGMVAVAAVNRLQLTPRLAAQATAAARLDALRQLRRNVVVEVATGAVIIAIVAVLGTTPPGLHQHPMAGEHHHSD